MLFKFKRLITRSCTITQACPSHLDTSLPGTTANILTKTSCTPENADFQEIHILHNKPGRYSLRTGLHNHQLHG